MRAFLHFVVPLCFCFFQKFERWTCPPFEEFGVLRSYDVSFSFSAREPRSDVKFWRPLLLCFFFQATDAVTLV